jgi:diaminopimelate decarboxylase
MIMAQPHKLGLDVFYTERKTPMTNKAIALTPWKRQGYLESQNGNLTLEGVDLVELAERVGTPHYVFSEKKLRANANTMLSAFCQVHPNTNVTYASKALANLSALKIVREEGLGVEVNSGGELYKALQAGFTGDQIVFNGVSKTTTEITAAITANIKAINVDSLSELGRIITCAKESVQPANIALRVVPEIIGGGMAGLETGSKASKFGMIRSEIMTALEIVNAAAEHVHLKGFHAHIGSQVNELEAYQAEAAFMIQFLTEIQDQLPRPLEHINLGGGFPISYMSEDSAAEAPDYLGETYTAALTNDDVAASLIAPLRETFGADIELIVEPGRSIMADTAVLLTRVEASKDRDGVGWLYLDAGYGIMMEAVFSWYFHMITANRADEAETSLFRVFGPLCDSFDVFFDVSGEAAISSLLKKEPSLSQHKEMFEEVLLHQPGLKELPAATGVGDIIAILDVGAYNIDTQTQYCGRLQPAVSLIKTDGSVQEIRRGDTHDDLMTKDR